MSNEEQTPEKFVIREMINAESDRIDQVIVQGISTDELVASLITQYDGVNPNELREAVFARIVDWFKEKYPNRKFKRISLRSLPNDLFLMKQVNWTEYETMNGLGGKEGQESHREAVERFLVFPKPRYEYLGEMVPGHLRALSSQVLEGLGFGVEATLKNV